MIFLHFGLRQRFEIGFGQLLEEQIVAQPPHRVAGAFLLAQHAEGRAQVTASPATSASTISRPLGS